MSATLGENEALGKYMNKLLMDAWEKKLREECLRPNIFTGIPYPDREPIKTKWHVKLWRRVCGWTIWHLRIVDIREYHHWKDCEW